MSTRSQTSQFENHTINTNNIYFWSFQFPRNFISPRHCARWICQEKKLDMSREEAAERCQLTEERQPEKQIALLWCPVVSLFAFTEHSHRPPLGVLKVKIIVGGKYFSRKGINLGAQVLFLWVLRDKVRSGG